MRTIESVLQRLRGEFLEMPGLRLTAAQVQRLCDIDPATCESVLNALVEANFLCVNVDRTYGRPAPEHHHAWGGSAPVARPSSRW
jgi:hypothetical protein